MLIFLCDCEEPWLGSIGLRFEVHHATGEFLLIWLVACEFIYQESQILQDDGYSFELIKVNVSLFTFAAVQCCCSFS